MKFKETLKEVTNTIKMYNSIQKEAEHDRKSLSLITFVTAIVTAIMSYMNYVQKQEAMMIATLVLTAVLLIICIISLIFKVWSFVEIALCVIVTLIFFYFTISGGNEGFAILWTLLLPSMSMLILGFGYGITTGGFFEVFFILLFWTPLRHFVSDYYSQTFMLRYPMLYTSFFVLSFIAKYLLSKQEVIEYNNMKIIEELSMIDQLTKIPNRRNFEDRLHVEWNRAIRNKETLCIMILDVDNFKRYNDTYGHLQGYEALKAISAVFKDVLKRSTDFYARWGGEEFIILLPETLMENAYILADKIREQVEKAIILLDNGETSRITVSIGMNSLVPTSSSSVEDFIRQADNALYTAKSEGRNRIKIHEKEILT